jgi:hypothetical protein
MNINIEPKRVGEGKLLALGLIAGLAAIILFFAFVTGGIVRHVPITWQEKIQTTIAFKTIDGKLNVVGIIGNSGINPTLLMRIKMTGFKKMLIGSVASGVVTYAHCPVLVVK